LKVLTIESFDGKNGPFKWTVREKQQVLEKGSVVAHSNILSGLGVAALSPVGPPPAYRTHVLVLLENAIIYQPNQSTDGIDDIVFAFIQTLKRLSIDARDMNPGTSLEFLLIGRGWVDFPALTHLTLIYDNRHLVVDHDLLGLCPRVLDVHICDGTNRYE